MKIDDKPEKIDDKHQKIDDKPSKIDDKNAITKKGKRKILRLPFFT